MGREGLAGSTVPALGSRVAEYPMKISTKLSCPQFKSGAGPASAGSMHWSLMRIAENSIKVLLTARLARPTGLHPAAHERLRHRENSPAHAWRRTPRNADTEQTVRLRARISGTLNFWRPSSVKTSPARPRESSRRPPPGGKSILGSDYRMQLRTSTFT